jgi:hypothetical protein
MNSNFYIEINESQKSKKIHDPAKKKYFHTKMPMTHRVLSLNITNSE